MKALVMSKYGNYERELPERIDAERYCDWIAARLQDMHSWVFWINGVDYTPKHSEFIPVKYNRIDDNGEHLIFVTRTRTRYRAATYNKAEFHAVKYMAISKLITRILPDVNPSAVDDVSLHDVLRVHGWKLEYLGNDLNCKVSAYRLCRTGEVFE